MDIFDHVIKDVLDEDDGGILRKTLDHNFMKYMVDILSVSYADISAMEYLDDHNKIQKTPKHLLAKFHILKVWNIHLQNEHGRQVIDWGDTTLINADAFNKYRVMIYNPDAPLSVSTPTSSKKPTPSLISNLPQSPASDFKRSMKRDKANYITLKDEKQWDQWKCRTLATIHAHGCENIVAGNYTQQTPDNTL